MWVSCLTGTLSTCYTVYHDNQENEHVAFIGSCRVAVQLEDGQDYIWVEGPKYRASTDYDSKHVEKSEHVYMCHHFVDNDQPPPGESTTHVWIF